jgi:hypothetical protein
VLKKAILLAVALCLLGGCAVQPRPTPDDVGTGLGPEAPAASGRANVTPRPTWTPCPTCLPCPTCPPTPTPTATPAIGHRVQPIPFGQPFELSLAEGRRFSLAVTGAYRGEEAWRRILEANQFNDPPPGGMDYLLLYVQVDYHRGPADKALTLDQWDFRIVSDNQILKPTAVVEPEPAFEVAFFPGASGGGWMAWTIFQGDATPLLALGLDYDGSGGTYFAAAP